MGTNSNPRSTGGKSEQKSKKFKGTCSEYDEIMNNCTNPTVNEGNTPQQCCKTLGVPRVCIGFCFGTNSAPRSLGEKSEKKNKKTKGGCSEYHEIINNCSNPTVDEEE